MNILFMASGVLPYPTSSGDAVLMYALIACLRAMGHAVTVVPVALRNADLEQMAEHERYLIAEGVPVVRVGDFEQVPRAGSLLQKIKSLLWGNPYESFHKNAGAQQALEQHLQNHDYQLIYAYSWDAVAAASNADGIPKIASLVTLLDDAYRGRRETLFHHKLSRLPSVLYSLIRFRRQMKVSWGLLNDMDYIVEHAAHHAQTLLDRGYDNVAYIPHPLPVQAAIETRAIPGGVNVLIPGSLKGIASVKGFEFFLDEILPLLKKRKTELKQPVCFRIVGYGDLPDKIHSRMQAESDWIKIVGFVDDLREEYALAPVVLVCVRSKIGFRTRIAEAFSYGKCVVSHSDNAAGIPVMNDGENVLMDETAEGMVDRLIRSVNDAALCQRLGRAARASFNAEISADSAMDKLAAIVAKVSQDSSPSQTGASQ